MKESGDVFGSQPERLRSIIMTAVMALALLISKVLEKARELSARLFSAYPKMLKIYQELNHQNSLCQLPGQSEQVGKKIWRKSAEARKRKCI